MSSQVTFEWLEQEYGPLDNAEETLLCQLTFLGRLMSKREYLGEENEFDDDIERIYLRVWKGLDDLRPDLLERFIEVEQIPQ